MKLSIIIVSWNVKDLLVDLLASIFEFSNNLELEAIVVDNNSSDNTVQIITDQFLEYFNQGKLKIIDNKDNKGFSKANNQGFSIAKGEYICFMNPDMRIEEDSFNKLINYYEQNNCSGVLGTNLIYEDLSNQATVKANPQLSDQALILLKLHHFVKTKSLARYLRKDFEYSNSAKVEQLMGAFLFAKKIVFEQIADFSSQDKNKPWDEDYPLWWEDVQLCKDAQKLGIDLQYTNITKIIHLESKSFEQTQGIKKHKRFVKGLLIYFKKNKKKYEYLILKIIPYPSLALAMISSSLKVKQRPQSRI